MTDRLPLKYIYLTIILFLVVLLTGKCVDNPANSDTKTHDNDSIAIPEGWKLVWHDEFNGEYLDISKWEHEVNAQGGGNNELQYYTDRPQNSWIDDTVLVIQALKETFSGTEGTREYTSARIRSKNKGDWKYGRFEIRAKLPYGQGLWPAIWLLPTDYSYGGWAASGEIDIMELIGHESNTVYGTLHYGGEYPNNVHSGESYSLPEGNFAMDFHNFSMEWDTTQFRWYVDDIMYQSQTSWFTESYDYPAPFDQRFHLLLNVAVGGNWPGNPDNTTSFPQRLEIDYVRVFQRE